MNGVRIIIDEYVIQRKKRVLKTREFIATIGQVKEAIKALDGDFRTMVTLLPECRSANLCVSGGNDGRYFVTVTEGIDGGFYTLLRSSNDTPNNAVETYLITGGQEVVFCDYETVDLKIAIKAAVHWAKSGERLPTLTWRRDDQQLSENT